MQEAGRTYKEGRTEQEAFSQSQGVSGFREQSQCPAPYKRDQVELHIHLHERGSLSQAMSPLSGTARPPLF